MKQGTYIALLIVAFILGALFCRHCRPEPEFPEPWVKRDTTIIRDTIRPPVPEPEVITIVRYDTIRPQSKPVESETTPPPCDTLPEKPEPENAVILPITQLVYNSSDYRAVVEGYKPRLVSIELYPERMEIANTITRLKSPRWAVTVGPGVGYGPNGVQPYVGVTVGFVLWSK